MLNNFLRKQSFASLFFLFFLFTTTYAAEPASSTIFSPIQENHQIPNLNQEKNKKLKLIYGIDFNFLLDNTEASEQYWPTRTLFAGSIAPEAGIHFNNQNLLVGGYFIQNMGEQYPTKNFFTFSYDFTYKNLKGYFGIFPKSKWIGDYPKLFFRKDFLFYNPLLNGTMFQYISQDKQLQAEFIFDWYGGNIAKRIDEFLAQGYVKKSFLDDKLFLGGAFLLYHFKNDEFLNLDGNNFDTYLLDRFYYQIFLGTNLTPLMPYMDKMILKVSNLSSLERKRRLSTGLDPFSNLLGWQLEFDTQYKGFGINNSIYLGKGQYKYFNEYGENFYAGLPFYQSPIYDRAEIYYEYKNAYLTGRFSFILHFMQNNIAYQQMLTLNLNTHKLFSALLGK